MALGYLGRWRRREDARRVGCATLCTLILRSLLAALLMLQVGGSAASLRVECTQSCPDDDEHGDCPPGCEDCACCGSASLTLTGPTVTSAVRVPRPVLLAPPPREIRMAGQVEGQDIWHIPKAS